MEYPWVGDERSRRYNWSIIIIDEIPDPDSKYAQSATPSCMYDALDGAYCNNDWLFRGFVEFYRKYLDEVHFHVERVTNLTYEQFEEFHKRRFRYSTVPDWLIYQITIPWLDSTIYLNEEIATSFYEVDGEWDLFVESFIPILYGGWKLITEYSEYFNMNTEEFKSIKQLLDKICKIYLPIYILITEYDFTEYGEKNWFLKLPDEVKMSMTKEANFANPIEDLEYTDIEELGYLIFYYLIACCGYPGRVPGQVTEDGGDLK